MCSGGGGSSQPTTSTVYNTNLPDYLKGPVSQLAGRAAALTCTGQNPYQSVIGNAAAGGQGIQGTTVAGETPMQQEANRRMMAQQTAPQLDQATGMTGLAAMNAQNIAGSYKPFEAGNQYTSPNAENVASQQFTGQNVGQYMDPYLQASQNAAISNYANTLPQLGGAATQVGGIGGSRSALLQAQGQQGLQQTLAGNQEKAFTNAQQQFNQSNQANLQAQMANQQARLQEAGQGAQYGLAGQQLNSQQQQFLANLGLQGNAQLLGAGAQMGQLGQDLYGQQTGITSGMNQLGTQQQQTMQNVYNNLAQNYQNYINYPYAQAAFMNGILRGTSPGALGQQTSIQTYGSPGSTVGQMAGLAGGIASMYGK